MKKQQSKKIITILLAGLILSLSIHFIWFNFLKIFEYKNPPKVINGTLDLRGLNLVNNKTLALNGDWEFYPSSYLYGDKEADDLKQGTYLNVPGGLDGFDYGSYRLVVLVDNMEENLAYRIEKISNSYRVYIEGELVKDSTFLPTTIEQKVDGDSFEIVIEVSNTGKKGGILKPIRMGSVEAMSRRTSLSFLLQAISILFFSIHSIYALILYFLGARSKGLIYFSILSFLAALTVLLTDDRILISALNLDYYWAIRLTYFIYNLSVMFLPTTLYYILDNESNKKYLHSFIALSLIHSVLILFSRPSLLVSIGWILSLYLIFSVILAASMIISAIEKKDDLIFLLLSILFLTINIFWAIIKTRLPIDMLHYPFNFLLVLFSFATFWFKRFIISTNRTKELAEKLQLEDKKKDIFLINTSHEIRNPLHGMMNLTLSILEDDKSLDASHKEKLELIVNINRRLAFMLNDLIDITRLKENTIKLTIEKINLASIVSGVFDMIRPLIREKDISLILNIDNSFPYIEADENRLIQILFNLLHNAVKFTDAGEVIVSGYRKDGRAIINIKDTGIGISEGDLARIFSPYEQSSSKGGGLGLGLNICRDLVELHGGRLTAESILGEGSNFSFSMDLYDGTAPLHDGYSEEPKDIGLADLGKDMTMPHITGEFKILAVDDDHINLMVLKNILESINLEVVTASNGEEALKQLDNHKFDLVITDVMMPYVSGYELTGKIRERFSISELPILLITARNRIEDISTGFKAGANDYVTKPVDSIELKTRVNALIQLKDSIDERLQMEAAWLQSQIEPHFIFNTLNSIAALGTMDIHRMQALLEHFSEYLRLSFDFENSNQLVHIDHELSLVRSYLYIEKERFGNRINIIWDIDGGISFDLPPLTIQPLVENAIKHGILSNGTGGSIIIRISQLIDHYLIMVEDDGVGMEEGRSPGNGIAIKNINRRLKQIYNEGLIFESSSDKGTKVSFKIKNTSK